MGAGAAHEPECRGGFIRLYKWKVERERLASHKVAQTFLSAAPLGSRAPYGSPGRYALTRSAYSPVRVSMRMTSPSLTNSGTASS